MIMLGWVAVIGLPLAVVFAVIFLPERIPKERTVEAIRQRLEDEESGRPVGAQRVVRSCHTWQAGLIFGRGRR
ncbi:hypothetical protein ACFQZZ_18570 [Nocardia sp. GCM10030253]|uniref:hypothetical protein n=1 Tax=Nocardia sp. GCM10030253 TaxID=3273404 RepID=UPI0036459C25